MQYNSLQTRIAPQSLHKKMNNPNPKRPCHEVPSLSSSIQNPNYSLADFTTVSSFLALSDSPSFSSSYFGLLLDQVLSSASKSSNDDSVHDRFIDSTCKLGSLLRKFTKRYSRERALAHNYNAWCLPPELTIKVFSMLDTKSLAQAAACCTMFRKCSTDPICYSHIDLKESDKRITDGLLFTMIRRSGKELRSLKLGLVTREAIPLLTQSCLASDFRDHGFTGDLLRRLHFYNLDFTSTTSLCDVLSVFPNLTDLKIVNSNKLHILRKVIHSLTKTRRVIEHLFVQNNMEFVASGIPISTAHAFVTSCPNLTSLTLLDFEIKEEIARIFIQGFPKLNYMNLSGSPGITGRFLTSDLGNRSRDKSPLKTLILYGCPSLNTIEISQFLESLITDDYFRFIRDINISSYDVESKRVLSIPIPKILLTKLKEERPDIRFVSLDKQL